MQALPFLVLFSIKFIYICSSVLEEQTLSAIPYSCCRSNTECYSSPIPAKHSLNDTWTELQNISLAAINRNGCLAVFSKKIRSFKCVLGGTVIAVVVLQVQLEKN